MAFGETEMARELEADPPGTIPRFADWLVYLGIAACSLLSALVGAYRTDADTVAYLDLSDAMRDYNWHSAINSYWFPLYPCLLTVARGLFGFRAQYDLMAARLLDAVLNLFFVLATVVLAASVRRYLVSIGAEKDALLPRRTLSLWVAVAAFFLASLDLLNPTADALVSIFMILTLAALFRALAGSTTPGWIAMGLCAGLAFWAKAFAFPFFCLLILLAALAQWRRPSILIRLALAVAVFGVIAAPLVWQISALRGRLTFGDSGRLNMAWSVNGADRFNPVNNTSTWQAGSAIASLKHPGELLSKSPSISYYGGANSFGSTPQFTDTAYWFDGLGSRFVLRQSLAAIKLNLVVLGSIVVMRLQVGMLCVLLGVWSFRIRRESFANPVVCVAFALALGSIGLYASVCLVPRYITFALGILAAVYAASSLARKPVRYPFPLHGAVLISAGLVLCFLLQGTLREWKEARLEGSRPLEGIYSLAVHSAAVQLGSLYPRGSEVACMGDAACWGDPGWVHQAGMRMTAIVETGNGSVNVSAETGCGKLALNPAAPDALRRKNVRAIVARFDGTQACSAEWKPLGASPNFFYLPL